MKAERSKGQKVISSQSSGRLWAIVKNRKDAICLSSVINPDLYLQLYFKPCVFLLVLQIKCHMNLK